MTYQYILVFRLLVLQIVPIVSITPPVLHIYVAQVPFHTWFNY
jgi:hypothetical protein